MARFTEKFWGGRWWKRDEWEAMVAAQAALRPKVPYVISDTMGAIRSQADGKMYDSKSRYYSDLRARGLECVGNDLEAMKPRFEDMPAIEPDLQRAIAELS
jgi:hypothetical protein